MNQSTTRSFIVSSPKPTLDGSNRPLSYADSRHTASELVDVQSLRTTEPDVVINGDTDYSKPQPLPDPTGMKREYVFGPRSRDYEHHMEIWTSQDSVKFCIVRWQILRRKDPKDVPAYEFKVPYKAPELADCHRVRWVFGEIPWHVSPEKIGTWFSDMQRNPITRNHFLSEIAKECKKVTSLIPEWKKVTLTLYVPP